MPMTQQYRCGEFAWRLAELEAAAGIARTAVRQLRREAEVMAPSMLGDLAQRALQLADTICWHALDQGDLHTFASTATIAADLHQFAISARLIDEP